MRYGQNPAKSVNFVAQPEKITVAVTTYIPFLSGYFAKSLDVLIICLESIRLHGDLPFDLMVVDNASCDEVINYLVDQRNSGSIQYLLLSKKNLGKVGAWNLIFSAAPGEFIAYSDFDVYFYPDWLSRHMEIFDAFPEAVTVTGLPRRGDLSLYTNTLQRLEHVPGGIVEKGKFIPDKWLVDHARSLGKTDEHESDHDLIDYKVTRNGVSAYATGTHFQFMVRAAEVKKFIPFPTSRPMGEDLVAFDNAMDSNGYLRLATSERVTRHIGNNLDDSFLENLPENFKNLVNSTATEKSDTTPPTRSILLDLKLVRKFLLWIYNRIFQLYYTR